MSSTWLITGASRGIGREFVRQILERGDTVFAAVRSPASAKVHLQEYEDSSPGKLHLIQLDVSDSSSIFVAAQTVKETLKGRPLNYLVNNAGIVSPDLPFIGHYLNPHPKVPKLDVPSEIESEVLSQTLATNVIGPAIIFRKFLPLLEHSERPVVVNITSDLGSISYASTHSASVTAASYSISKAALNMLTVKQATEKPHIICLAIDPGWVSTDMGGPSASLDAKTTVKGQLQIITCARLEDSGIFKRYDGTSQPW